MDGHAPRRVPGDSGDGQAGAGVGHRDRQACGGADQGDADHHGHDGDDDAAGGDGSAWGVADSV